MNDQQGFMRFSLLTMFIGLGVYHVARFLDGNHVLAFVMTIIALALLALGGGRVNARQLLVSSVVIAGMVTADFIQMRDTLNIMAGTSWFLSYTATSSVVAYVLMGLFIVALLRFGAFSGFHLIHSTITLVATFGASAYLFGAALEAILPAAMIYVALTYPSWSKPNAHITRMRDAA